MCIQRGEMSTVRPRYLVWNLSMSRNVQTDHRSQYYHGIKNPIKIHSAEG